MLHYQHSWPQNMRIENLSRPLSKDSGELHSASKWHDSDDSDVDILLQFLDSIFALMEVVECHKRKQQLQHVEQAEQILVRGLKFNLATSTRLKL